MYKIDFLQCVLQKLHLNYMFTFCSQAYSNFELVHSILIHGHSGPEFTIYISTALKLVS